MQELVELQKEIDTVGLDAVPVQGKQLYGDMFSEETAPLDAADEADVEMRLTTLDRIS